MPASTKLFQAKIALRRFPLYRTATAFRRLASSTLTTFVSAVLRLATRPFRSWGLARGSYSLLPRVRNGADEGRILLEDQGNPVALPESLMVRSRLGQHQEQPWPIFWARQTSATLIGESLALLNSQKELCLESVFGERRLKSDPAWHYFMCGAGRRLRGPWTSLVSRWVPRTGATNFAHWLTEALPRLASLEEFPPETRILVPEPLQPFQSKTLEWLGVLDRCRPVPGPCVEIEEYYFFAPPCMVLCYSPYSIQFLRKNFLARASAPGDSPPRFYLRRKGRHRTVLNEGALLEFFTNLGWAVVDTAEMAMDVQIALFKNAEAIVAVHGAGLANMTWCPEGCKVLELCPSRYLNPVFEWMAQVVGAEYRHLVFPADHAYNCVVDIAQIRAVLSGWGIL